MIDAIVFFMMDPEEFDRRYNNESGVTEHDRYRQGRERSDYRRSGSRHSGDRTFKSQRARRSAGHKRRSSVHVPERRRVNPYKQEGIKKYKDYDLDGAIEDFEKGLELDGRDVALHFNIACAYSLSEKADKAYFHLDKAIELGFRDFDRIQNHDDLAFVRIQPQFDEFKANGFRLNTTPQLDAPNEELQLDDALLTQLNRLKELRDKGLITDQEFNTEKAKLTR